MSSFFLGVSHKKREDEMPDLVRRQVGKCGDLGILVGPVMLDRGFYTTGVMHSLKEIRAEKTKPDPGSPFDYLMQCRRTKRVKDTLGEYAESGAVASGGVITGRTSESGGKPVSVPYCIHVAKSKAHEAADRRNKRMEADGRKKTARTGAASAARRGRRCRPAPIRTSTPDASSPGLPAACRARTRPGRSGI